MRRHPLLTLLLSLAACPGDVARTTDAAPDATSGSSGDGPTGGLTSSATATSTSGPTTSTDPGDSEGPGTTADLDDSGAADTTTSTASDDDSSSSSTGDDPPDCGNAQVEPGELCDDANADETDHCLADCTPGPVGLALPLAPDDDLLRCITPVGDGLALGGERLVRDEAAYWARVRRIPLPAAEPADWAFLAGAGADSRVTREAATAADGDVVVAGAITTGSFASGSLWLARLTPAGETVWSLEFPGLAFGPDDLEVAPSGDIVVVGHPLNFPAGGPSLAVFTADGEPVWDVHEQPEGALVRQYNGLTIGDDGAIYIAGDQWVESGMQTGDFRVLVRAFAPDGAPLWEHLSDSLEPLGCYTADIVRTTAGRLVVATALYDLENAGIQPDEILTAFDATGAVQWSHAWQTPDLATPTTLLAADDGGFYVNGGNEPHGMLARFDALGAPLWARTTGGGLPHDATFGPDGWIYTLSIDRVTIHAP